MEHLLNNLETILSDLIQLRSNLNSICESSLNLLFPQGTQAEGSYRIENNVPNYASDQVVSEAGITSTSSEGDFDYVNDLIAYGKSIRDKTKSDNDRIMKRAPNAYKEQLSLKSKTGTNTTSKCSNNKQPTKNKSSESIDTKPKFGKQPTTVKKSLYTQTQEACNFVKEKNLRSGTERGKVHSQIKVLGNSSENKCEVDKPMKYLHSCSLSLSDTVKTLKMPEDLRYLLKQFYHYENNKRKEKGKNFNFKERFSNNVKSRLKNDIQISLNQGERYLKYLDVADGFQPMLEHKSELHIAYKSSKQLCLYEAKCQQLMELQLQEQLIDVINELVCA